jgi:capsular exopolysaccharide synthesis family protein
MVLGVKEIQNLKTFEDSLYTTFKNNLRATVGKDDDIITVSFDSPYKGEAKWILEEVIKAYAGFHTKENQARFAELTKWREKTRAELEKKQQDLVEFKRANGALSLGGEKGNIVVQKLERLEQALTDAHVEKVNAKSALDSVKGMTADPEKLRKFVEALRSSGGAGTGSVEEQSLRSQLFAMENQMGDLRRRYLPDHPAVRAAQQTSASLRARIGEVDRSMAEGHLMRLEQELTKATNRERELQQAYDDQKKAAMDLSHKMAQADALDSEVKRLAGSVDKADQQMIEATAAENVGVPNIQVFDEPNLPSSPIKPVRNVLLFQGLILGLLLGCGAALVRDWTDQGLRSADDVIEAVNAPILGSVPHVSGPANPIATGRKVELEPASEVAETYRTIRTGVFFGTPERESRTILVTSPAQGEGKSTFASNLAIAMAQTGKRVILIDADFRNPVQHRVFECRPSLGLTSVLTGGEPVERAIQSTGIAGLDILAAGPVPSNPAEILNNQLFTEVLEELSVQYDHVVIDSPPVMMFADARILAAVCSVTILVLRATTSTRKGALQSKHALEAVGGHLLGVVVNDVPRSRDASAEYVSSGGRGRRSPNADYAPDPRAARPATDMAAESFFDLRRK